LAETAAYVIFADKLRALADFAW